MPLSWTVYESGVEALAARGEDASALSTAISREAARIGASAALIFSSDDDVDPDALARALALESPLLTVAGCSTAGEMGPAGIGEGGVLALLFPRTGFAVSTLTVENVDTASMAEIAEAVASLRRRHLAGRAEGTRNSFAICLIDGMSFAEERVTASIFRGLDDIPLIGGSAGDSLAFKKTQVIADGTARPNRAMLALVTTSLPFRTFKSDNFVPVDCKFVVTASDPDRRVVMELNARPAAHEYAEAIGRDLETLTQTGFASHPVIVRVGGEHYCRAIRGVDEDGSLLFACAIDDGVVLTLAEARGMVESTRVRLEELESDLGGVDFVLGFDCAYRRIDAQNRQVIHRMSDLYRRFNVVGFGTYGEQYQSMHLNQTLTGVAFGRARSTAMRAAE